MPLDDAGLKAKFLDLVGPVLGAGGTRRSWLSGLWAIEEAGDVAPLVESMAKPSP